MSGLDERELLIRVFLRLRQREFDLGVGDLRDALRLLDGEWPFDHLAELRQDMRRLWCRSWEQEHVFGEVWDEEERVETTTETPPKDLPGPPPLPESDLRPQEVAPQPGSSPGEALAEQPGEAVASTLPVKMPDQIGRAHV